MRLERTVIHRVGPFEHFELDLTKTLGPLIAVVAPNGSGKSFLLEASILGAAFRRMPSQGRLLARATAADAYLESTFVNGSRHTVRHLLGRKAEALVLLEDGVTPAYEDDVSVGAFDEWVQAHFPDQELLCATQFAVQKSEGFIGMGSAARIDVILSATGVSRIDRMSKLAGKRASEVAAKLATNRQRLADAREGAPELAEAEAEFVRVNGEADAAETRAAAARAALAAAEAEGLRVAELRRQAVAAGDAREALERAAWKAIDRRASLERRLAENDPETAEAEAREHDVALGTLRGLLAG
ncbi:MAG TPA: hypothetical protein VGK73_27890, partial [Polyangiaceae bacterium]